MARNWRNILYNSERYLGLRRPVAYSAPNQQELKKPQPKKLEEKKYVGQCLSCPNAALCQRIKGRNHTHFCFHSPLPIIRDYEEREEKYEFYTNGNGNLPLSEPMKIGIKYPKIIFDYFCNEKRRHGLLKDRRVRKMDRVRKVRDLPFSEYYLGF
jgi:hypothetical protein